jgi:hypothetical protein
MAKATTCVVYWLYNDGCICPWRHGYIGISVRWPQRLYRHKIDGTHFRVKDTKWRILFIGTQDQCLELEKQLRPHLGIGWNKAYGGETTGKGIRGIPKSPEWREKMRLAALARYAKPGEKERTAKAVKNVLRHVDRSGENNSHFGKPTSESAKQKMRNRIAERGGVSGKRNPNYRHGRYC